MRLLMRGFGSTALWPARCVCVRVPKVKGRLVVFYRSILETEDRAEQGAVHAHIKSEQVGTAALVVVNI